MPWSSKDSSRHTHAAKTPKQKRAWAEVSNKVLKSGGSEGKAIRIANAAVKQVGKGKKT